VLEAARAINDAPIVAAQPALAALLETITASSPDMLVLRSINAHFRLGGTANARVLVSFASQRSVADSLRVEALIQLSGWSQPAARDRIVGVYRPLTGRDTAAASGALAGSVEALLSDPSEEVVLSTLRAVDKLGLTSAGDALFALASRDTTTSAIRIAALKPLAAWKHPRLAELIRLAGLSNDAEVRAAAQNYFSHLEPKEAVPLLIHAFENGKTVERQNALANLAGMDGAEVDAVFLILKDGSSHVGSIASETDSTITLRPASGESPVQLAKASVVKRESAPSSMPEIYGLILSRSELRDLVAYVTRLGTQGSAPAPRAAESH